MSQKKRKLVEQVFGWMKTMAGIRKTRHRGREKVEWVFTFAAAAYNLVRLPKLLADPRVQRQATELVLHAVYDRLRQPTADHDADT